ncbi:CsgG/HfaB family protein [Pandoraea sputorum]|uniref:CsgG/HfaB family protein n=1 Tax=Pandoraea sputorum TaxID=93222 RepID=UPI001E468D2A|nr:CsgG/HfaB family protein [Pandoraea sputorum]MCE4062942.1 CsgG/HfaB family protein [Pandoraea sputorum]
MAGCSEKAADTSQAQAPASAPSAAAPVPDVGKVETEKVTASGFGDTAGEATTEAMKLALLQVNGAVVQAQSVVAKYGLDVSLGQDSASLRANAFAEVVAQRSGGVIQHLRVLSLDEPGVLNKRFKATIEADIAKFKPSADMQKLKVVVGPVLFAQDRLPMGDTAVPSSEVAAVLRQRVSDALVQTGRFAVLDREMSPEIEHELDIIASGQAPSAELTKLSQAASADLVWSARVSAFNYTRMARQLRTSDRQLVSYSGGWALSQKMVNVATRQVTAAGSLSNAMPATAPTTLSNGVDSQRILTEMVDQASKAIVSAILQSTFPITVLARDGTNVVVSQGGQALREGGRYAVVAMGNEFKDPQTGQSLGRTENPCCELVVERVTQNLSYGHLDNVRAGLNLDTLPIAGLQVRGELAGRPAQASQQAAAQAGTQAVASAGPKSAKKSTPSAGAQAAPAQDDKW